MLTPVRVWITMKSTSVQSKKHKQLRKCGSYKLARFLFPRLGEKITCIPILLLCCLTAAVICYYLQLPVAGRPIHLSYRVFALFSYNSFKYGTSDACMQLSPFQLNKGSHFKMCWWSSFKLLNVVLFCSLHI